MSFTFKKADMLLPKTDDLTKWSVVACDQYTSQPDYWNGVKQNVGGAPSCLNLVFPEIYLKDADFDERIASINSAMKSYIDGGVFKEVSDCFIYVERTVGSGKIRRGIMGVVDLEDYDYAKGSESRIRATEGTVLERIPPC